MARKPRPRRHPKTLRIEDYYVHEWLAFLAGWQPPATPFERKRSRWQTWTDYLTAWQSVRRQYFDPANDLWRYDRTPVAELLYRKFGTDGPPVTMTYSQLEKVMTDE